MIAIGRGINGSSTYCRCTKPIRKKLKELGKAPTSQASAPAKNSPRTVLSIVAASAGRVLRLRTSCGTFHGEPSCSLSTPYSRLSSLRCLFCTHSVQLQSSPESRIPGRETHAVETPTHQCTGECTQWIRTREKLCLDLRSWKASSNSVIPIVFPPPLQTKGPVSARCCPGNVVKTSFSQPRFMPSLRKKEVHRSFKQVNEFATCAHFTSYPRTKCND